MQTQSDIRALLAAEGLAPQHRFGQNFLVDLNLMRKIPAAADVRAADVVLEVGPGTGSLTELLLDTGARVVAVEIDRGFQAILRQRLGSHPRFTLVQADALAAKHQVNPLVLQALREQPPTVGGAYKLVANLPYQIATPLIMDLLYATPRVETLTCTIQREVGERLAGAPRTEAYGPASVVTQTLARIELLAILPATAFWPRPQIESVLVRITRLPDAEVDVDDVPAFVELVQRGFQQRRKMLRRLLRDVPLLAAQAVFERAGVSPDVRPEELAPDRWRAFYRACSALPR